MASRLRRLAEATDTRRISFIHNRRAETVWRRYLEERNTETRLDLALWAGVEAFNAGATERAIQYLLEFRELAEVAGLPNTAPRHRAGRDWLALAYLRLGEQENCLAHHGAESCLMPIRGGGLHRATRGSRLALNEFGALLRDYPDDLRYRWLYNLAAMTLGKYPAGVPAEWRIPASAFDSGVAFPRFHDVATEAGVAVNGLSGGIVLEDLDGDGLLDVMASSWDLRDPIRYFRNDGRGRFEERTEEAGLTGITGGLNLVHADYDNDGDADVLVLRGAWLAAQGHHPNSLLRNDGDGTFEDVALEAGLAHPLVPMGSNYGDIDGDGLPDDYFGTGEHSLATLVPNRMFRNAAGRRFEDVTAAGGFGHLQKGHGIAFGDIDNDGDQDIYAVMGGAYAGDVYPNVLSENPGTPHHWLTLEL
jgi:hypothetical protein